MCDALRKNIKLTLFIDMHRILLPCLQFPPSISITEMMAEATKKKQLSGEDFTVYLCLGLNRATV